MWKCKHCLAVAGVRENIKHSVQCAIRTMERQLEPQERFDAIEWDASLVRPTAEERRAIAAEKHADALMHLATAHVDGMRALEALCRAALPAVDALVAELKAELERRKKP